MKISIIIIILNISIIFAQGITNTIGGNTANDKFIVENVDAEVGLVITGEGNVGIGTNVPTYNLDIFNQSGEAYARIRSDGASSSLIIDKYWPSHLAQIVYQQGHDSKFFTGLLTNNNYRISTDRFSLNGLEVQENGIVKMTGFEMSANAGEGYILTSDSEGKGSWQGSKTNYLSIPSAAFLPSHNNLPIYRSGPFLIGDEDNYNYECFFPIMLPDDAIITQFWIVYADDDANNNITVSLNGWNKGVMAELESISGGSTSTSAIDNPVIDNFSSYYWLEMVWSTGNDPHHIYLDRVRIDYTH